ncbi:Elongation factor Ts [Desulfovibrionales bacterium]
MADISIQLIKILREKTGAGITDCKKALEESSGDEKIAIDRLRQKGLSRVAKRAGRATSEGIIGSYIHSTGKIGVMVEVKCETDFVARSDKFQEFAKNVAMQIAATSPICVSFEQLSQEALERDKAIYRQQALDQGRPEKIIDKIVEGRMVKYFEEVCLLEQSFIKDDSIKIKDLLNQLIAVLGENIQIGRFTRMQLGEKTVV